MSSFVEMLLIYFKTLAEARKMLRGCDEAAWYLVSTSSLHLPKHDRFFTAITCSTHYWNQTDFVLTLPLLKKKMFMLKGFSCPFFSFCNKIARYFLSKGKDHVGLSEISSGQNKIVSSSFVLWLGVHVSLKAEMRTLESYLLLLFLFF